MKQYLITAYDYTDGGALERRMNIRPHHLEGLKPLKQNQNYVIGGAMLNDGGKMIGKGHGGSITVETKEGVFTEFIVRLQ